MKSVDDADLIFIKKISNEPEGHFRDFKLSQNFPSFRKTKDLRQITKINSFYTTLNQHKPLRIPR